ncbi:YslB family protein [Aquibacillus sediminis]|uniref:YslB family protein n=1 Tax=Aquibacillus sediminis TaxID=2574734 RepID=UPI0011083423|nr:YslB family protein [Aquibacillus sediminis]
MPKDNVSVQKMVTDIVSTGSGYDLLRYYCLPDLLGKDTKRVIYVMGKNIARETSQMSVDDIIQFFNDVGWGYLTLKKEKRKELIFELTGETITNRIDQEFDVDYRLEAGFLAQAVEQVKEKYCECIEEVNTKKKFVQFTVYFS